MRLSPSARRALWRRMYAPLLIGILLLSAAAAGLFFGGVWSLRGWADVSVVFLLSPLLLVAVGLFLVLFALAAGVGRIIQWIPSAADAVRRWLDAVQRVVQRVSDLAAKPFLMLGSFAAILRAAAAVLRRVVRTDEG